MYDLKIVNGLVYDGSGGEGVACDIAISDFDLAILHVFGMHEGNFVY